jgi:hypothetical protein
MVLEALIDPKSASKSLFSVFVLSLLFVASSVVAVFFLGAEAGGYLLIAFTVIPAMPLIGGVFQIASETEAYTVLHSRTIARHLPVILILITHFLGLLTGFLALNLLIPDADSQMLFSQQISTVKGISTQLSGNATAPVTSFEQLFWHNSMVVVLIILFSLLYGAGSLFVVSWNASIAAVFAVLFAKKFFAGQGMMGLLYGIIYALLGITPHAFFEYLAYFTAALSAGIMNGAIARGAHESDDFIIIVYDAAKLLVLAIAFLGIGALIEAQAI